MMEQLLELEERGWQALSSDEPVKFCEEWLASDAVMIVPGVIIDRETFLRAVGIEQPWASHRIEDAHVLSLTDESAALIYRVTARRAGQPDFIGLLTSIYVKRADRWKLVLHQQTPAPT
ncbi:MAG TPA: nuclear transport factor 2 family protein [Trebonia sp.]